MPGWSSLLPRYRLVSAQLTKNWLLYCLSISKMQQLITWALTKELYGSYFSEKNLIVKFVFNILP